MKKFMTKVAAGAAVAVAALLVAPAMASAAPGYPTDSDVTITNQTVAPGGTVSITIGNLTPGSAIVFSLTGANAAGATLATLLAAPSDTMTFPAQTVPASGVVTAAVTLPANAACNYTLTAVSGGWSSSWPINTTSDCLPNTGGEGQTVLYASIAGGALALLGGAFVLASTMRKRRQIAE